MEGAITFHEVASMPYRKYAILRRAVEIEQIEARKVFIQDLASGFGSPKKAIEILEKQQQALLHKSRKRASSSVNWKQDDNWINKLNNFRV